MVKHTYGAILADTNMARSEEWLVQPSPDFWPCVVRFFYSDSVLVEEEDIDDLEPEFPPDERGLTLFRVAVTADTPVFTHEEASAWVEANTVPMTDGEWARRVKNGLPLPRMAERVSASEMANMKWSEGSK